MESMTKERTRPNSSNFRALFLKNQVRALCRGQNLRASETMQFAANIADALYAPRQMEIKVNVGWDEEARRFLLSKTVHQLQFCSSSLYEYLFVGSTLRLQLCKLEEDGTVIQKRLLTHNDKNTCVEEDGSVTFEYVKDRKIQCRFDQSGLKKGIYFFRVLFRTYTFNYEPFLLKARRAKQGHTHMSSIPVVDIPSALPSDVVNSEASKAVELSSATPSASLVGVPSDQTPKPSAKRPSELDMLAEVAEVANKKAKL
jgi:hypothetical protein